MNKNTLLNTAVFLCKLAKLFIGLIFIATTVLFIHFQIDRFPYQDWNIKKPTDTSSIQFVKESGTSNMRAQSETYPVGDWSLASLYFYYLKFGGILILILFSIHQFQKVMQSVKNLDTFQNRNVRSFRKIGLYCLLIFCLNIFNYLDMGAYISQTVSFKTSPLLIALFAFIFAEIFKEGNLLMEENKLTV